MCYVGGGDVTVARWEMNKCVRTRLIARNARERWVLRVEMDCGTPGTSTEWRHTQCTIKSLKKKTKQVFHLKNTHWSALEFKLQHRPFFIETTGARADVVKRSYFSWQHLWFRKNSRFRKNPDILPHSRTQGTTKQNSYLDISATLGKN